MQDFTISLHEQKVEVKTSLSSEEILETIKKTGKEVKYLSSHIWLCREISEAAPVLKDIKNTIYNDY